MRCNVVSFSLMWLWIVGDLYNCVSFSGVLFGFMSSCDVEFFLAVMDWRVFGVLLLGLVWECFGDRVGC